MSDSYEVRPGGTVVASAGGAVDGSATPSTGARVKAFVWRNWRFIFATATAALDTVAFLVAAAWLRWLWPASGAGAALGWPEVTVLVGLMLLAAAVVGLYRRPYVAPADVQVQAAVSGFGTVALFALAWHGALARGVPWFVVAWLGLAAPITLVALRGPWLLIRRALQARGWAIEPAVLLAGATGPPLGRAQLRQLRGLGYDVLAQVMLPDAGTGALAEVIERQLSLKYRGTILVPALDAVAGDSAGIVDDARSRGLTVKLLSADVNRLLGRVFVHDVAGITLESPRRRKISFLRDVTKRAFDVVGSVVLLALALPVLLVIAALIRLESSGAVLFRQRRRSAKGLKPFDFFKFRSMYLEAESQRDSLQAANDSSGALFKMRDDPRITAVGRVLRRWSLDELPQLLNVLRGDMSLVGPRPLPMSDFDRLVEVEDVERYVARRGDSKPGITGLWQICGRSDLGYREMVLLDLYYVENRSVFLDLQILLHTLPVVLSGRGAY